MMDESMKRRLAAWTREAEAGDVGAMEALAFHYDAVRPETLASRERMGRWLGAAAKAGSAQAAFRLAEALLCGRSTPGLAGLEGSPREAHLALMRQAAAGGVPMAMYILSQSAPFPEWLELLARAACRGVPEALRDLSLLLFDAGRADLAEPWLRRLTALEAAAARTGRSPYTWHPADLTRMWGPRKEPPFLPDPGALWRLGVCRERAGDVDGAMRLFWRVASRKGLSGDAYTLRVRLPGGKGCVKLTRRVDGRAFFSCLNNFKGEARAHLLWMAGQGLVAPPSFTEANLGRQGRLEMGLLRHPGHEKERLGALLVDALDRLPKCPEA